MELLVKSFKLYVKFYYQCNGINEFYRLPQAAKLLKDSWLMRESQWFILERFGGKRIFLFGEKDLRHAKRFEKIFLSHPKSLSEKIPKKWEKFFIEKKNHEKL